MTACWVCRVPVRDRHDQFEHRLEFRRMSDEGRHRVVKLELLCFDCAVAEVAKLEKRGRPPADCLCGQRATMERRHEFRRKSDDGRWRVVLDGRRCNACTDTEVAKYRPDPEPPGEQGGLF
jgi:hypothetical protein